MHLYNLTLHHNGAISKAIYGSFSQPKVHEVVAVKGQELQLIQVNDQGKMQVLYSTPVFGQIRDLLAFRQPGGQTDYVIVGSDSGKIDILHFNLEKNCFDKIQEETFGKTGCRRIVPGQYLAADPKGRAIMISAVEKNKLVYVINRDQSARLTISSPLEAHKSHNIIYDCVGVDVGFENPIFACLELDYADGDDDPTPQSIETTPKCLTFYELDLGLNHVVRKWTDPVDDNANMLVAVPGGADGPGGVLVCSENFITYKNQGYPDHRMAIPRRRELPDHRTTLITAASTHRQRNHFFFIVQSEYGDLYKISIAHDSDVVNEMDIQYFDTIQPCTAFCVMRNGFFFTASESGNHSLYHFSSSGDENEVVIGTSLKMDEDTPDPLPSIFRPHELSSLVLVDEEESLAPLIDMAIADLCNEETPQLYSLCGQGHRSSLRVLKHGLPVNEMAVSGMPGNPSAVWTVKSSHQEEFDSYIVVSFTNATLVLSIGETVEEVTDSGFLASEPTLAVGLLADNALIQIHPNGIRHIRPDRRVNEWRNPCKKPITAACVNTRQVVVAMATGEVFYFELDPQGILQEINRKDLGAAPACLALGEVPPARQRTRFLAVGGHDETVKILSLDPHDDMQMLSMQALPAEPHSLLVATHTALNVGAADDLYLYTGLVNGVLLRTSLDQVTGDLSDTRTRFLGSQPVKLFHALMRELKGVLALSSRSWACYTHQRKFHMHPLSYPTLEHASTFSSAQCPEGFVAIAGNTLRIISLSRLGEPFNITTVPVRYTPRRIAPHLPTNTLIVIESQHGVVSHAQHLDILRAQEESATDEELAVLASQKVEVEGLPLAPAGVWASCVRVVDPKSLETVDCIELDNNECAVSLANCVFHDIPGETFVLVGVARNLQLKPRRASGGAVHVYRLMESEEGGDSYHLALVHTTELEGVPTAMASFQGRVLVGFEKTLRMYDLGKKRLLRKCENKHFPNIIVRVQGQGDRVVVSDVCESCHFVKYTPHTNKLMTFADDAVPRHVVSSVMVDYDTVGVADKFGNISVLRLPEHCNENDIANPSGSRMLWSSGYLNGAPNKMVAQANFHVGDILSSLHKTPLIPGGVDCLVYSMLSGGVGVLLPIMSREDVDFFQRLEMHLRQEQQPLCGRDHLVYRSTFFPVKDVIDGDLCELFSVLPHATQVMIAESLQRSPAEVEKKLADLRNRII